jgi:hypothetical protein
MPAPRTFSVTVSGRIWNGGYSVTPDAWVEVVSAYGSGREPLSMDDETPLEQAQRMLREILANRPPPAC